MATSGLWGNELQPQMNGMNADGRECLVEMVYIAKL
jgi:hypothetical protein